MGLYQRSTEIAGFCCSSEQTRLDTPNKIESPLQKSDRHRPADTPLKSGKPVSVDFTAESD
jgi:hypothetical protein